MADSFCTFLDFRSLPTNYNFNLFLPPKHYYPHSHNSRIKRIKRRPFHLTLLSTPSSPTPSYSSSDFDVISTHEHPDGSLVFRFGDPSEVAKNVKMEESNNIKEETQCEDKTGYGMVLDNDHEKEVMQEIADREATASVPTDVADDTNSEVITSESIAVFEGESDSRKKLLEGSDDFELPVLISSKEMEVSSTPGVEIEHTGNVEEGINEECDDSSSANTSILDKGSEMENNNITAELSEEGAVDTPTPGISIEQNGNIEESLNEERVNSSPSDALVLESNSDKENYITEEEFLETEVTDVTMSDSLMPDPVITMPDDDIFQASADSNPSDASVLENNSEVENIITTEELLETEAADVTILDSLLPDPVISVPDNDFVQASADSSPSDASVLENNSEIENIIAKGELLETEAADITILDPLLPDPVISAPDNDFLQASVDSSPSDASVNNSETENIITTEELLEPPVAADVTILDPLPDPVISVPDNDFVQANLDTIDTADVSAVSHQSVESEMQNEIIEDDGRESFESELVSPPHQSEPAISLSEEIEEKNLQAGMEDLVIGQGTETDMNDIKAIIVQDVVIRNDNGIGLSETEVKSPPMGAAINRSEGVLASRAGIGVSNEITECGDESDKIQFITGSSQLVAESMFDEETDTKAVEESKQDDVSESLTVDLILGAETNEVDSNAQSGDGVEASVHEVTELMSTDSTTTSQEIILPDLVLSSGAALMPHPSKVLTGGEDAYFITGQTWLGVADGVGQWSLQGTKPGVYAQELMKNCERLISNCNDDSVNSPLELLKLSVAETDSAGSSTVLIAHFDGQALHVANVGDSGFIVLRHGAMYKRCSPMHHVFHFPRRIERGDDPSCLAELYRVDLDEDDVIITATDGLFDNLYDQEISLLVKKLLAADKKPQEIAELLATEAQERGRSPSGRSPFGDDAQAAGFAGYTGGKLDDITLVVSVVRRRNQPIN